jgi:hypothetical protein
MFQQGRRLGKRSKSKSRVYANWITSQNGKAAREAPHGKINDHDNV